MYLFLSFDGSFAVALVDRDLVIPLVVLRVEFLMLEPYFVEDTLASKARKKWGNYQAMAPLQPVETSDSEGGCY